MAADEDRVQIVLLRILGVLLIAVGFALIAQQVRSDATYPIRVAESIVSEIKRDGAVCDRRAVHVQVHTRAEKRDGHESFTFFRKEIPPPPRPPMPPAPPALAIPSI